MSRNIAVIYPGDLAAVAEAFGEAAGHLATGVRLLRVGEDESDARADGYPRAGLGDLEWADGIAFGTPIGDGSPAAILMRFIASTEPLWSSGRLYEKAVTVFTDEPEHFAPDSVLHPIYDALYQWGAVIIGPRAFELALDAHPTDSVPKPLVTAACSQAENGAVPRSEARQAGRGTGRRASSTRAARAMRIA